MCSKLLIIAAILASLSAQGQGSTVDGLKSGFWTVKPEDDNYTLKGNYKIIPLAKYDTIRKLGTSCYKVKYKRSLPAICFDDKVNEYISVKDSIWNSYNETGHLRRTTDWNEGLNLWSKYYDENGNLNEYYYNDYDNDTSFQLTYIEGQLFKIAFYPPENKNQQIVIYYPNEPLTISDAELNFTTNFLNRPTATKKILIAARKDLIIKSISPKREFVKITTVNNRPISFPLKIKANTSVPLKVSVSPTSANYQMTDTLMLTTTENEIPFKIYLEISAHHIDEKNVGILKSIQLSKSKDKNLILARIGTVNGATIISKNGETHSYEISESTKIDLSVFPVGIYQLFISSCNRGGELKLVITE